MSIQNCCTTLTQGDVSLNLEETHYELITRIPVRLDKYKSGLFNPPLLKLIPSEDPK
jgi:hypothetical protein